MLWPGTTDTHESIWKNDFPSSVKQIIEIEGLTRPSKDTWPTVQFTRLKETKIWIVLQLNVSVQIASFSMLSSSTWRHPFRKFLSWAVMMSAHFAIIHLVWLAVQQQQQQQRGEVRARVIVQQQQLWTLIPVFTIGRSRPAIISTPDCSDLPPTSPGDLPFQLSGFHFRILCSPDPGLQQ